MKMWKTLLMIWFGVFFFQWLMILFIYGSVLPKSRKIALILCIIASILSCILLYYACLAYFIENIKFTVEVK